MRQFANMQDVTWRRCRAEVALALALGPVFAWIDPFGATREVFSKGVVFWTALIACWFVSLALARTLLERSEAFAKAPDQLRMLAILLMGGMPMVVLTGFGLEAMHGWEPDLPEFIELYAEVILMGAIARLICAFMLHEGGIVFRQIGSGLRPPSGPEESPAEPRARLQRRLPPELRGQVICLEMQDHYVRIHTDRGSAMILLRLQDAIAELEGSAGRQVHRSWWVLDDAVTSFGRVRRSGTIQLRNGLSVPVSQRYLSDAEAVFPRLATGR